jgi:hypothetical protein
MIRVDGQPRRTVREAGVRRSVPLHRRARVVAADRPHRIEHVVRLLAGRDRLGEVVERLDVLEVLDAGERRVRHPELLALVDVRRPAVQVQHDAEQLRGGHPVLAVVAEARHDARLVVVVPVLAVPAALRQPRLPAPEDRLELRQAQRKDVPLRRSLVDTDVLELEDHVDLAARRVGEQHGLLDGHARHLADGQQLSVAPGGTSRCISCRNSWMRGPEM